MLARPVSGEIYVQPMKIELTPRPGQLVRTVVRLQNVSETDTTIMYFTVNEMTQWENALWRAIEPGSDFDTSKLASCREWISLSHEGVELLPMKMVPLTVTVRVPPGVRGFYAAAIVAETVPRPEETGGVAFVVQFIIPVLLEIEGRPIRSKVELTDVGMEFREETVDNPATSVVSISIANSGGTYSRLKPLLKLRGRVGEHWREITTTEFREVGIIPGAKLKLEGDIKRPLPSGKYSLNGTLHVDGRRAKPIKKEIDFTGDPSIKEAATDAALQLRPTDITINNSIPGATRSAVLNVYNASDEAVNVRTALVLPPILRGVAFGQVRGDDLNCTGWVKVVPETFTLRGGGRQNIRIIAEIPNAKLIHPSYYALLILQANYPDGRNAGVKNMNICVENSNVKAEPAAQPMKLTLAIEEDNKYVVVARFANAGSTHFAPKCRVGLINIRGVTVTRILMAGKPGLMLPLELRDFSGVLDFSTVPAGTYRLAAMLEYADRRITIDKSVRVTVVGEQRIVEIIG
jgi:hypothetical protein